MRFRILGPVDCATGSGELLATGQRQQKLLAALLLDAGRAVSTDTLISIVWDDWPPATARNQIHTRVSRLRRAFAGAERPPRIASGPAGYWLHLDDSELDVAVFRDLVARGLRLLLRLGRGAEVLDALPDVMARHPLHEGLVELRMCALLQTGRRAEALGAYSQLRERLADELGLDPRQGLVSLHRDILRGTAEAPAAARVGRRSAARSRVRRTVVRSTGPRSRPDGYAA